MLLQERGRGEERGVSVGGLIQPNQLTGSVFLFQECSFQNISQDTMSFNILQASLVPSQEYQVKVRTLVVPGDKSIYGGVPSEWSGAVTWTSHEGTLLSLHTDTPRPDR